jgi:hypothetical protein
MRQQMLRDIKILSEGHDVPGLLSFLGAYLVPEREQVQWLNKASQQCAMQGSSFPHQSRLSSANALAVAA